MPPRRRKLDRVRQQIGDNLSEPCLIPPDDSVHISGQIQPDFDALAAALDSKHVDHGLQLPGEVEVGTLELQTARFNLWKRKSTFVDMWEDNIEQVGSSLFSACDFLQPPQG